MARPIKRGLEYFPFDVSAFSDPKLFILQNEKGPCGIMVYLRLLNIIYGNSYYYEFKDIRFMAMQIAHEIGQKWIDVDQVTETLDLLVELELLDKNMFALGVLTSRGIQKRYMKAVGLRRSSLDTVWRLVDNKGEELPEPVLSGYVETDEKEVSATETGVFATETGVSAAESTQSKGKKSKEKKSKAFFYSGAKSSRRPPLGGTEKEEAGSFDTDEFFNLALQRSYESVPDTS